ncbi:hypothetical protein L1049_019642 [Liquidambar formosana]|uniref:Uncharacterized protein n=1 Tax=Liquidambar formosana TaxID=63359 RepID=A0AAP0S620_LIQFO
MAEQAALTIGELPVPVVVLYAGAKVGLHVVEKLALNRAENIRGYLVDPIEEYVVERSEEHDAVLEDYVVVPMGDCVAETIKNYALAPIQKKHSRSNQKV